MKSLKAIETRYKGYRFRSRLEARWAVFFDALGIEWQYELEGFELLNGKSYLPDFYLPDLCMWVEIKPFNDFEKAEQFVFAINNTDDMSGCLWAAEGMPSTNLFKCIFAKYDGSGESFRASGVTYKTFFLGRTKSQGWFPFCHAHNPDPKYWDSQDIEFAINAARSARFEHGAQGAG